MLHIVLVRRGANKLYKSPSASWCTPGAWAASSCQREGTSKVPQRYLTDLLVCRGADNIHKSYSASQFELANARSTSSDGVPGPPLKAVNGSKLLRGISSDLKDILMSSTKGRKKSSDRCVLLQHRDIQTSHGYMLTPSPYQPVLPNLISLVRSI